jgi:hypothetical protein
MTMNNITEFTVPKSHPPKVHSSTDLVERNKTGALISKLLDNKHNLIDKAKRFNKIKL